MLVVGGIIGAGFLSPAVVPRGGSSSSRSRLALGAVIAMIGGFVYAELGAGGTLGGGTYVYLREAWDPCRHSCTGGLVSSWRRAPSPQSR